MEHVSICEVGPRDGLQIAKTRMDDRRQGALDRGHRRRGRAGDRGRQLRPAPRHPADCPTRRRWCARCSKIPGLTVQALAPNLRGVQNAYNAGVHKISIPVSVSEGHSRANLNRTPAESIEMMRRLMDWLKAQPRKVPVVAGCSTAFGCSIDGVVTDGEDGAHGQGLADAGVDQIMLADTVGYAHPAQIKEVVRATREAIGRVLYGLHLHDTCGLGIANALAGLEEGIRAFDSCLAGLGGCPVRARRVGQRGDRGSGVHAGEHGLRHRHRPAEAVRGAAAAARGPAGGAAARAGAEGRHSEDVPRRRLIIPAAVPTSSAPSRSGW